MATETSTNPPQFNASRHRIIKSYCYCKSELKQTSNKYNRTCVNCCQMTINQAVIYECNNRRCYYGSISTQTYTICSQCHKSLNSIDSNINEETDDKFVFIRKKFNNSMEIIS